MNECFLVGWLISEGVNEVKCVSTHFLPYSCVYVYVLVSVAFQCTSVHRPRGTGNNATLLQVRHCGTAQEDTQTPEGQRTDEGRQYRLSGGRAAAEVVVALAATEDQEQKRRDRGRSVLMSPDSLYGIF